MSASRSKSSKKGLSNVIGLSEGDQDESGVASCLMAYLSTDGEFHFECDFKTDLERDALVLRAEIALHHLRSRIDPQITAPLNLAA